MNCPNCGRELAEGEICICANSSEPEVEQNTNTYQEPQQAEPVGAYYNPNASYQGYYNPPINNEQQSNQQYYAPEYQQNPQYYVPNQKPPVRTDYPEGYKIKKKYVAVLLGAFLGVFGIHNFYLGNSTKAIAQLLLSTVGAVIIVGPIASLVWSLVETVLILTEDIDADANNFKIQTFEESLAEKLNK